MANVALDTNHDLLIENNNLKIITDAPDEVVQKLRQRFKHFVAEWFLDTSQGIPYFEKILKKRPNPQEVDAILKNVILGTPGVIELREFELDFDRLARELTLKFKAISQDGLIEFNEVIP